MPRHSPIAVRAQADDGIPTDRSLWQQLGNLGPWGSSALLHAVVLGLLLLCKIPFMQTGTILLTAFTGTEQGSDEELSFFVDDLDPGSDDLGEPSTIDFDPLALDTMSIDLLEPSLEISKPDDRPEEASLISEPNLAASIAAGSIGEAGSVEEAVDQITGGIQGQLEQGDVLVIWLLDSSLSLQEDRQRIAGRLEGFLKTSGKPAEPSENNSRLVNAVVTFGRGYREAVSPTESSQRVLHSIQRAKIDKSGQENVFLAVQKCISNYRKKWKSQMMIVIWTDESGDDVSRLNTTIERARQANVIVSVVGRSAVLGDHEALHDWIDPVTKSYQQLPIRNGPDSAMLERLRLGYWFRGPPPREIRQLGRRFPVWYGNDDLIGLSSGFSPWALTRLTLETGGSFTIFDSQEERAPYDPDRLARYRPAYASMRAYQQELKANPLRQVVHRAVGVTHGENIELPDLMFFGLRSPDPPHTIQPLYFSPGEFRSRLNSARGKISRKIKRYQYQVEKALAHVSATDNMEQGLEAAYQQETSPRWQAWYELTRGRLLAVSVRAEEYRLAMESILTRDALRKTTNGLVVGPSNQLRSEGKYARRADEATRLLSRCQQSHADTPWAYLAQRELVHGLGIQIQQVTYTPSGEISKRSVTKAPKF